MDRLRCSATRSSRSSTSSASWSTEPRLASKELGILRELLRRELDNLRAFISQLRPPLLDELGLDGAIMDTIEHVTAVTGLTIATDLAAPSAELDDRARTVALRIAQEALQNVRKHASADPRDREHVARR